jgi:hypothetical protein
MANAWIKSHALESSPFSLQQGTKKSETESTYIYIYVYCMHKKVKFFQSMP